MITIKIKLSFSLLYEDGGPQETFNQKSSFITQPHLSFWTSVHSMVIRKHDALLKAKSSERVKNKKRRRKKENINNLKDFLNDNK